nr:hypothetical protein [Candidatus Sigynarchaeota archaeon]
MKKKKSKRENESHVHEIKDCSEKWKAVPNLRSSNASPEFLAKLASFAPETFQDALEGLEERERMFFKRSRELYGTLERDEGRETGSRHDET